MKTCVIPGCGRPHVARGCCQSHYDRWRHHGDPLFAAPLRSPDAQTAASVRVSYERSLQSELATSLERQAKLAWRCHTEGGTSAARRYWETTKAQLEQSRDRLERAAREASR